jgi:tight adherence protein B
LRRVAGPLLSAAALCLLAPSAASADGLRLTSVGEPHFPQRAFILSLPAGQAVESTRVAVRENGAPVAALTVSSATAGPQFGVVLAIDASNSMRGTPIADAMEAARVFARERDKSQPLGVVTFNSAAETALPLTTDSDAIDAALASPPALRRHTHVYDGVQAATSMLADFGARAGTVVVLSDGSDTGSAIGLAEATRTARKKGVRVFTVGLRSTAFEGDALARLASGGGGRYSEATDASELAGIYSDLAGELSRQHLIQYRSLQRPKRRVEVVASVEGLGQATATYRSPALSGIAAEPYDANDFWSSPLALVLVSLACGGLAALAFLAFMAQPHRRRLRERLAMFLSSAEDAKPAPKRQGRPAGRALHATEQRLSKLEWWPAFRQELDVAQIKLDPTRVVVLTVAATLFLAWLLASASGSVLVGAPILVAGPVAVRQGVRFQAERQRRLFAEQLADNLGVIASAQRAGHSFLGALTVSIEEAPEPTKTEFERALADERLGLPVEDALGIVAKRMNSRDLEQVILVARLQRETGGNTAEVLDRVADTVRERGELRRLIRSLTAQGRMSRWIITALPITLLLIISAINPQYMEPLFTTTMGNVAVAGAALLLTLGSLSIKRIVSIKV